MEQIASPDVPAYACYLVVIAVGVLVGISRVNTLMSTSPSRWAFFGTWTVLAAYAVVPVALFWFLDYTNALHDTSLFAALIVAFGYRQILAGQMQGVALSGQISKVWSPIETWANQVRDRILTKSKRRSDRFNKNLSAFVAGSPTSATKLTELAFQVTTDRDALQRELARVDAQVAPTAVDSQAFAQMCASDKVRLLLQTVRLANPEDYGFELQRYKVISPWQYFRWLGDAQGKAMSVLGALLILAIFGWAAWVFERPSTLVRYQQWRFAKLNASEQERFRAHQFFGSRLNASKQPDEVTTILAPLIDRLHFRELDRRLGDDILRIVVEFHQSKVNAFAVPALIEALRTENPDLRLRIHNALEAIRGLDYPTAPGRDGDEAEKSLQTWTPSKEESPAEVEKKVMNYRLWWKSAAAQPSPTP